MAILKRRRGKRTVKPKAEKEPKVKVETQRDVRKITLRNEFHKTEVNISVSAETNEAIFDEGEVRRIKAKLYGVGCNFCGNELGMKGHQDFIFRIDPLEDKAIKLTILG